MEPVGAAASKKRGIASVINWQKCFICQHDYRKNRQDKLLRNASEDGLKGIRLRACERVKYKDVEYVDTLDQFQKFLDTENKDIQWHKTRYSAYTNVTAIARLNKRFERTQATTYSREEQGSLEPANSCHTGSSSLQSLRDFFFFSQKISLGTNFTTCKSCIQLNTFFT